MSRWFYRSKFRSRGIRIVLVCALAIHLAPLCCDLMGGETDSPVSRLPSSEHIENLIRIGDRYVSGGQPKEEEAFKELKRLDIRTIVSVDGLVPNVELAEKYGMKYLHAPIGYSGISPEMVRLLAAIPQHFPGRIYIHCHHGKHRGPAAAAICGLSSQDLQPSTARDLLKLAGTSPDYPGLWDSVTEFHAFPEAELAEVTFTSEVTKPSISQAMAELERAWESIDFEALGSEQLSQERTYQSILEVAEHFAESARFAESGLSNSRAEVLPAAAGKASQESVSKPLNERLTDANAKSRSLLEAIKRQDLVESQKIARSIAADCKSCHQDYRNRQLDR